MKTRKILFLFFVSATFFSPHLFSASDSSEQNSELKSLREEPPLRAVVTATRREMSIEKITRFMTVITRQEIEKSGAIFVLDLLRATPGVTVTQSGPSGRTVGVFIRGMNTNQTLIMLDGVEINSPTTGAAEISNLMTENIERIEILRGPQSTLYGSDAMAGVINIVTKAGQKPFGAQGRFEYGTDETFHETGSLEGQWKNFSYSGFGSRLDTDGPGENDRLGSSRAGGHAKVKVSENSNWDTSFHFYNALEGIEDGPFQQDPNVWQKSQNQILNTAYTLSLFDWWEQSFRYAFFHDMLLNNDPTDPGTSQAEFPFRLFTDRHTAEYQTHFFISDFDVITAGYEFEHAASNNKTFDKIIRDHGYFIQNELTLWKIWTIVGGVRIDNSPFFGTEASPLASSGLWIEKTQTKLKGSFGRGFRAPSMNELFFPNFGNPNLQAEKSWGWDAGFEQYFWNKKASVSANYFHNSIENLIQFTGRPLMAQNIARAKTQGVELEFRATLLKDLEFRGDYNYTDAIDATTKKRLIRRPWHSGRLGLSYHLGRFRLNFDWVLVGTREDRTALAGRPPREKNPGYTRLDAMLSFDLNKWTEIYFRGEDLTDDHYDEVLGFDNPAARFFVGTKLKY